MPGARYQVLFLFPFFKKKSVQSYSVFYFVFHLSCHKFIRDGFQQLRLPSIGSHKVCFSGWSRLTVQLNLGTFLFGFLLFLIIFFHMFQEAISALRVLNIYIKVNTYINSLGKNFALNLFAHNNVHPILGDILDSSSFALVTGASMIYTPLLNIMPIIFFLLVSALMVHSFFFISAACVLFRALIISQLDSFSSFSLNLSLFLTPIITTNHFQKNIVKILFSFCNFPA